MKFSLVIALSALLSVAAACSPGTYICGPPADGTAGSAVYVCASSGEYELVAECGDRPCLPTNGGAYCE